MKALRVLIVEDEPLIALLFEEVLSEMGHDVCASERTEAGAIAAAARCRPELIIADARLHEGSGIDAVNAILKTGFIPHIFVSGDVLDRKLLNPAACVLQKPFHETQLVQAIERGIDPANILIGKEHGENARRTE
jgi:two-component system, response regulator PdtaR